LLEVLVTCQDILDATLFHDEHRVAVNEAVGLVRPGTEAPERSLEAVSPEVKDATRRGGTEVVDEREGALAEVFLARRKVTQKLGQDSARRYESDIAEGFGNVAGETVKTVGWVRYGDKVTRVEKGLTNHGRP
jgi:hypothetical protein